MPASCTINTLLHASSVAYFYTRDRSDNEDPSLAPNYRARAQVLTDNGYHIDTTLTSRSAQFSKLFNSNLGAVTYKPLADEQAPIIIGFRGTKSWQDVRADVNLFATGTIGHTYRSEAYDFYKKTREQYPNREIIITGHSLGGHLAQYVAAKAVAKEKDYKISVRTFNTASIKTVHQRAVEINPKMRGRFVNYRLDNDVVSWSRGRIGDVYSFANPLNRVQVHLVSKIPEHLPPEVLAHSVDPNDPVAALKERIIGFKNSYQCKVNNQWFAGLRGSLKQNEVVQKGLDEVLKLLSQQPLTTDNYNQRRMQLVQIIKKFPPEKKERAFINLLLINNRAILDSLPKPSPVIQSSDHNIQTTKALKDKMQTQKALSNTPKEIDKTESNPTLLTNSAP